MFHLYKNIVVTLGYLVAACTLLAWGYYMIMFFRLAWAALFSRSDKKKG